MSEIYLYEPIDGLSALKESDWVRIEDCMGFGYERIDRVTTKLFYVYRHPYSRVHGAYFDVGIYDTYKGRIRPIAAIDHPRIGILHARGVMTEGQAVRASGLRRVEIRMFADAYNNSDGDLRRAIDAWMRDGDSGRTRTLQAALGLDDAQYAGWLDGSAPFDLSASAGEVSHG